MRPRLLDLFCGAGGAAMGYHRAGFDVVGVDIVPQPNYPFKSTRCDALIALRRLIEDDLLATRFGNVWLEDFSAIHASPPCQHYTVYGNSVKDIKDRYDDLLEPTRDLLELVGLPYVIENVERAPLHDPLVLCGSMFDLDVKRHRLFETNWPVETPVWGCRHKIWGTERYPGGNKVRRDRIAKTRSTALIRSTVEIGTWSIPLETQQRAMGIDWMNLRELSEAIPPAYTEFIGAQLLAHIGVTL